MKKSILFSSITTTCLLIQTSASAGVWFITDGSLALNARAYPSYVENLSFSNNLWTKRIYAEGYRTNSSECSTLYSQGTSFQAHTWASANEFVQASSNINGGFRFYNEYESLLNLNASIHLQSASNFGIKIEFNGVEAINLQGWIPANTATYSASSSYVLRPDTFYYISLDMESVASAYYGGSSCTFDMTVSDIPAPAASALLAIAGLVSRRRRA